MFLMLPGAQKSEGGEDGQYEDDKNIEYIYRKYRMEIPIDVEVFLELKDCRGHLSQNIYLL